MCIMYLCMYIYIYIFVCVCPQSHQDVQLVAGVTGVAASQVSGPPCGCDSAGPPRRNPVPVVFEFWILWGGGVGKSNIYDIYDYCDYYDDCDYDYYCYYFIIVIDVLEYDDYDDFYQDHPFDFYLLELFSGLFGGARPF